MPYPTGGNYHNLSKLGELNSFDVSSKVKEMVEAVDGSVGAILAAVRENGLTENTLVFFTSDNGGYLTYQGGYHNISSNGPLRGQKGDVYEGGHRVPAIAWWPRRIRSGTTDALAASFDLFPTIWELADIGSQTPAFDGTSLAPVLFDGRQLAPRTLYWKMRSEAAVRRAQWKLVQMPSRPAELYDLANDLGESHDLAASRPALVKDLSEALTGWERSIEAGRP